MEFKDGAKIEKDSTLLEVRETKGTVPGGIVNTGEVHLEEERVGEFALYLL